MGYIEFEVTWKENDGIDTGIILKEKLKDFLAFINILYTHTHTHTHTHSKLNTTLKELQPITSVRRVIRCRWEPS